MEWSDDEGGCAATQMVPPSQACDLSEDDDGAASSASRPEDSALEFNAVESQELPDSVPDAAPAPAE